MEVLVTAIRKPWLTPALAPELKAATDPEHQATVATAPAPLPHDLRWTASHLQPEYRPVESWLEIDLLLMQLSEPGLPYVVVESRSTRRFAQAMGESDAMIIEVCSEGGMPHPAVWRLRRAVALPYAALATHSWDGDGVAAETLFTAEEASVAIRGWLREGALPSTVTLEQVVY
jgi:hypothetical protein